MSELRERFLPLLERHVKNLRIHGNKATGLAPCHDDRSPSLSADLEKGVWFCHACGRGGGVKAFAEIVGEGWNSTRSESRAAKAHRTALAVARDVYRAWERRRLVELTDEYRRLNAERKTVEKFYRLLHRQPGLCSENEAQHWEGKLAAIYEQLAPLEWDLDVLTYREHEQARFEWWREETEHERISA